MKKRSWAMGLVLLMVAVLVLSACGKSGVKGADSTASAQPTADSTATAEPQKDVDLRVINFRVEDQAYYDEVNKKFEEKYPYIHVKYDAAPTKDWGNLKTSRIATNDVDVVGGQTPDAKDPNAASLWLDLKGQPFLDGYIEGALKGGQSNDGTQYLLPSNSVSVVTFYNKKIFADLGLAIPKTWDEFIAACDKIKAAGIDPIMFGGKDQWPVVMQVMGIEMGANRSSNPDFFAQLKDGKTKFTDPAMLDVFTKYEKMTNYFQKNAAGLDYGQAPALFAQGKAAMMVDGSWSTSQIVDAKPAFEVGAFLTPGGNTAEANAIAPTKIGSGFLIYKKSPNQDAALKYLAFLSEKDIYQQYINAAKMWPVKSDTTLADPLSNEIAQLLGKQLPMWDSIQPTGANYNFVEDAMKLLFKKTTPAEAVADMQKKFLDSKPDWK
ncbi:ABC transporter substrate-binding protein [Paenibacillus psychroresistens]|uniref:ABC transporter substrate-binding protein n=1 Tax=Paenibacillus psychroresistens TaxID=1778678 RepID=UPI001391FAB5|nr:extracellular solute-binding protein [Paenibacillus psychroresistens]